jgi:hypothetical protein
MLCNTTGWDISKLINLCFSKCYCADQIKENIRWVGHLERMGNQNYICEFGHGNLKGETI